MPTATIYGHTDDGYIYGLAGSPSDARATATNWNSAGTALYLGQDKVLAGSAFNYYCYRGYLLFGTSVLPAGAVVTDVRLSLQAASDYSDTDFDVKIYRFAWDNPMSDVNREANYDAAGAIYEAVWRNTAGIVLDTYYQSPALDVAGINLAGYTKYQLRSSRDVDAVDPTGVEAITLWSADQAGQKPKLDVIYSLSAAGTPAPLVVMF